MSEIRLCRRITIAMRGCTSSAVISGWGVIARTSEEAHDVAQNLVDTTGPHGDAS
ncbi:MAG: hypothetical protein J2P28_25070 [Actinobacteria bacterium]|nr:hypothetical protein [Actinomycetota bacterium]